VNADDLSVPFNLWFEPNPELRSLWPETRQFIDGREIPFYEQLQQIPNGSVMFEIWAQDLPDDPEWFGQAPQKQHIGNIRTTTDVITSAFGDERLFFNHELKFFDWSKYWMGKNMFN
jgi:hypothetical protein